MRHETNSKEYWNYDLFDMWNDIDANIDTIKAYQGYDTFWYIGYSGGASQMLYALKEQYTKLERKLRRAILLAPCTFPQYQPAGALSIWESGIDVYAFSDPDWSAQKTKACTVIPESQCDQLNVYNRS